MVRGQAIRREASKGWTLAAKATGHHQGVCQPAWAECWISARFQTGNKTAEPFICVSLSSHIKDQSGDGFSFCCHLGWCVHILDYLHLFAENFQEKSGRMDNIYFLIFYDRGKISCSRSSRANECGVNVEVREHSRNFLPVRQTKLTTR